MKDVHIIIAHSNENIKWVTKLKYSFDIYSCHSIREDYLNNIAREAYHYLKYIIDNYYNLHEYTIFIHGHEKSWHQLESIVNTIKKLKFNKKYYNINVNDRELQSLKCVEYIENIVNNKKFEDILLKYLGISFDYSKSNIYKSKHNGQFYVHKDLILQYSLNQWKDLYNSLYKHDKFDLSSYDLAIVFECMWFFIFTHEYIDNLTE